MNGIIPFVAQTTTPKIKEIARDPDMRFDAWILKKWQILPSNPDFLNLTLEQKKWLWEDYLLDNPDVQRKIDEAQDEEFQKEWNELDSEEPTVNYDEEFEDISDQLDELFDGDDIERSEEAERILANLDTERSFDNTDWEEVMDEELSEDPDWEEV